MPRGTQGEARRPVIQLAGLGHQFTISGSFPLAGHSSFGDRIWSLSSGPVDASPNCEADRALSCDLLSARLGVT